MKEKKYFIQKNAFVSILPKITSTLQQSYSKNQQYRLKIKSGLFENYRKIGRQYLLSQNKKYQIEKLALKLYGVEEFRYTYDDDYFGNRLTTSYYGEGNQNRQSIMTRTSQKTLFNESQIRPKIPTQTSITSILSYKSLQPIERQANEYIPTVLSTQPKKTPSKRKQQQKNTMRLVCRKPKKSIFYADDNNRYIKQLNKFQKCLGSSDCIDSGKKLNTYLRIKPSI